MFMFNQKAGGDGDGGNRDQESSGGVEMVNADDGATGSYTMANEEDIIESNADDGDGNQPSGATSSRRSSLSVMLSKLPRSSKLKLNVTRKCPSFSFVR